MLYIDGVSSSSSYKYHKMNNWSNETFAMQHVMSNMGMAMNIMTTVPQLLPAMCMMPDARPINSQAPAIMSHIAHTPEPDPGTSKYHNESVEMEDVIAIQEPIPQELKKPSNRNGSSKRDRDRDHLGHRLKSKERDHKRHDRGKRGDRNSTYSSEKHKWTDKGKDMLNSRLPAGLNATGNRIMSPGMSNYSNIMNKNMMQSNMVSDIQNNMMMQKQMEPGTMRHMQSHPMNMMNNMVPTMIDKNMMMMNQQMMITGGNETLYTSVGLILPPEPGYQTPQHREKPKGCRTLVVSGLPASIQVETVNEMFQRFGPLEYIKPSRLGAFHVCFLRAESVDEALCLTGHRFQFHTQSENELIPIVVDYAQNLDNQFEYEKLQHSPSPPREVFTANALSKLSDKIKTEEEFSKAAPILASWLERGECNKKNANSFYSLIQVSNNQIRRLYSEKMQLDEDFQALKSTFRKKFGHVLLQFEQVAKILSAAKHQRVSDHFTKQQRRNIEMWLKMTQEVENIREEFHTIFDDDVDRIDKNVISIEKFEDLKSQIENLTYEMEGYKNEAYVAKDEAERKFEKFKAHYIAQQALENKEKGLVPRLQSNIPTTSGSVPSSDAMLISILTAFLMVHPLGASLDCLTSYVKSMKQNVDQLDVEAILEKYPDVFRCNTTGVGASIDHRWTFVTFENIKCKN